MISTSKYKITFPFVTYYGSHSSWRHKQSTSLARLPDCTLQVRRQAAETWRKYHHSACFHFSEVHKALQVSKHECWKILIPLIHLTFAYPIQYNIMDKKSKVIAYYSCRKPSPSRLNLTESEQFASSATRNHSFLYRLIHTQMEEWPNLTGTDLKLNILSIYGIEHALKLLH